MRKRNLADINLWKTAGAVFLTSLILALLPILIFLLTGGWEASQNEWGRQIKLAVFIFLLTLPTFVAIVYIDRGMSKKKEDENRGAGGPKPEKSKTRTQA